MNSETLENKKAYVPREKQDVKKNKSKGEIYNLDHTKFYLCWMFYFVGVVCENSHIEMVKILYSTRVKERECSFERFCSSI